MKTNSMLFALNSSAGSWSDALQPVSFPLETGSADDTVLRVIARHEPPALEFHHQQDGTIVYDGFLFQVWLLLAARLNLRYTMIPFMGRDYGTLNNGTWEGMVAEVVNDRADLILSWLSLREDRQLVVDYVHLVPAATERFTFFAKKVPARISKTALNNLGSLFKHISMHIGILIVIFLFIKSIFLWAIMQLSTQGMESHNTVIRMTWPTCLLYSFMTLVGQGWAKPPHSLAARILIISAWLLGIIILQAYNASLISQLTVSSEVSPANSLSEIQRRSDWTIALRPHLASIRAWKDTENSNLRQLSKRILAEENIAFLQETVEGYSPALAPKTFTYASERELFFFLNSQACALFAIENVPIPALSGYITIAKNMGDLNRRLAGAMMRLQEAGILRQLWRRWMQPAKHLCETNSRSTLHMPFGLLEVFPILAVLAIGIGLSITILIAENLLWRRTAQNSATVTAMADVPSTLNSGGEAKPPT